ncbi:hypothetical protein [Aegicerativicinus sediminis]
MKRIFIALGIFCLFIMVIACKEKSKENPEAQSSNISLSTIEITTNVMDFQMPDTLNSGWTTFKYINKSDEVHFLIFEKMPDSVRFSDYKRDIFPSFLAAHDLMSEGNFEAAMQEFGKIPAWFSQVKVAGGVGMTSERMTAQSTIYLEPGVYVMECYVRMPDGKPHALLGMIKEIIVTDQKNPELDFSPDYVISVSTMSGIQFNDSIPNGNYQFEVNFKDQKIYESMLGHDVNLVRLEEGKELDSLANWLNASDFQALRTPAPQGYQFLGGVQDLEANQKGYFSVELRPGNYVLISEIPDALNRNMYKTFNVYTKN